MKQNVFIVSTYVLGFILLNIGVAGYIILNPDILDNEALFTQISITANTLFYFATALIITILFRKYILEQLKDFTGRIKQMLAIVTTGLVGIYLISFVLGIILTLLGVTEEAANQQSIIDMLEASTPLQFALMIIFITVLAPIVEEIVFRKGVYGIVGKISQNFLNNRDMDPKKSHLIANIIAIAISSLIFGAIHAVDVYILIYAGLGVALGTDYYMSNKNVFAAICVHILYNSISIILTLLVF